MLEFLSKKNRISSFSPLALAASLVMGGVAPAAAQQPYSPALHDFLVRQTAVDHPEDVARILRAWLTGNDGTAPPADARPRVLADAVALLARAGQDRQALALAQAQGVDGLPAYTLDALFVSARHLGAVEDERRVVRALVRRAPDEALTRLRKAQYAFDDNAPAVARAVAASVWADETAPREVRSAAAELMGAVQEQEGNFRGASQAYGHALELMPQSRSAKRADVFVMARQGAARAALDEARPPLFSDVEILSLRQQAIGQDIAWGIKQRDIVGGARRYDALDQALAASNTLLAELDKPTDAATRAVRDRARVDRLVALNARGEVQACVDEYESLAGKGVDVPYYGLSPAADAYARLRRSDRAVPLYERAIELAGERLPVPSDTHVGLFYAYIDTGRFAAADALLQQLEAATPPTVRQAPLPDTPNEDYARVRDLRGRYYLYTDQPARAEATYEMLVREAPFNAAFAEGRARAAAAREHPHQALSMAQAASTDHPDAVPVRSAVAEGLAATGQQRDSRAAMAQLHREYPEAGLVQNAARDQAASRGATLNVQSQYGKGNHSSALSDEDFLIDARLQSGLIDDQWRVFARQAWSYGDTSNGRAHRGRTGLGLRWERDGWDLEAEAHRDTGGPRNGGFAVGGSYRLGDHVELSASYDSNALDVPWRAYDAGIAGRQAQVSAAYLVNESRRFDLSYQRMQFTDGNVNQGGALSWTERWFSGPSQQFQTTLRTDVSRNRNTDVPYYSPASDGSVELEARYQLLTWKRDDKTMVQRFYVSAGSYRQHGYGSQAMAGLRYEHEWTVRPGWSLTYGIGTAWHPYDGQRERRTVGYLNVAIPFY